MQKAVIISGFPGIGKTHAYEHLKLMSDGIVMDSDSSKFDKSKFPDNYIEHIKAHYDKVSFMFVSSHKEVRDAMKEAGINFIVVYPNKSLKEEYLKRYKERGNAQAFIDLLDKMWDTWIDEIEGDNDLITYALVREDVYLLDIIEMFKAAYEISRNLKHV